MATNPDINWVPTDRIFLTGPYSRRSMRLASTRALAEDIRLRGFIHPLLIRPCMNGFALVDGHRRFAAATMLGLSRVPCVPEGKITAPAASLTESLVSVPLRPYEKASAFSRVRNGAPKLHVREAAARAGMSPSSVSHLSALHTLPAEVTKHLSCGEITPGHAVEIARLRSRPEDQIHLARISARQSGAHRCPISRTRLRTIVTTMIQSPSDPLPSRPVSPSPPRPLTVSSSSSSRGAYIRQTATRLLRALDGMEGDPIHEMVISKIRILQLDLKKLTFPSPLAPAAPLRPFAPSPPLRVAPSLSPPLAPAPLQPSAFSLQPTPTLPHTHTPCPSIPIAQLSLDPARVRTSLEPEPIQELAQHISTFGLHQPLLVRPLPDRPLSPSPDRPVVPSPDLPLAVSPDRPVAPFPPLPFAVSPDPPVAPSAFSLQPSAFVYQIIVGARRYHAAILAGLTEVPCVVCSMDDQQALETSIAENVQRDEVSPIDRIHVINQVYNELQAADPFATWDDVSRCLGLSTERIRQLRNLCELPSELLTMIQDGEITAGHASILKQLGHRPEVQLRLAKECARQPNGRSGLTCAQLRARVENAKDAPERLASLVTTLIISIRIADKQRWSPAVWATLARLRDQLNHLLGEPEGPNPPSPPPLKPTQEIRVVGSDAFIRRWAVQWPHTRGP